EPEGRGFQLPPGALRGTGISGRSRYLRDPRLCPNCAPSVPNNGPERARTVFRLRQLRSPAYSGHLLRPRVAEALSSAGDASPNSTRGRTWRPVEAIANRIH